MTADTLAHAAGGSMGTDISQFLLPHISEPPIGPDKFPDPDELDPLNPTGGERQDLDDGYETVANEEVDADMEETAGSLSNSMGATTTATNQSNKTSEPHQTRHRYPDPSC